MAEVKDITKEVERARKKQEATRQKAVRDKLRDKPAPGALFVRPFEKVQKGLSGVIKNLTSNKKKKK